MMMSTTHVKEAPRSSMEVREEKEWRVVLAALEEYKARFGNLRVPTRFRVAADDESWPRECRDLRLGTKVAAIRSQGKFVSRNDSRRELLDEMGFEWQLRRLRKQPVDPDALEEWETFILAYETWQRLKETKDKEAGVTDRRKLKRTVPKSFVVPRGEPWPLETRGLPLGQSVTNLKAMANKVSESEPKHPYFDREKKGISFETQARRLNKLAALGLRLKRQEDYVRVKLDQERNPPPPHEEKKMFSSPHDDEDDDFSSDDEKPLQKKKVRHTAASRQSREEAELARLSAKNDERFELIVEALKTFRQVEGEDAKVSQMFVVPDEEPWPEATRGMALGLRVTKIRLTGTYVKNRPERVQRLVDLGFDDVGDQWLAVAEKNAKVASGEEKRKLLVDEAELNEPMMANKKSSSSLKGGRDDDDDDKGARPWWDVLEEEEQLKKSSQEEEEDVVMLPETRPRSFLLPLSTDYEDPELVDPALVAKYREEGWNFDDLDGDFEWPDVVQALIEYESRYGDFDVPLKFVVGKEMRPRDFDDDARDDDDDESVVDVPLPREKKRGAPRRKVPRDPSEFDGGATDSELDAALAALLSEGSNEPTIEELLALERDEGADDGGGENKELFDEELRRLLDGDDDSDDDDDDVETEEESVVERRQRKFAAPLHAEPWPVRLEGMKLGKVAQALRVGDVVGWDDPERRKELDDLGFDWGDRDAYVQGLQWPRFMAVLFTYSKIMGSLSVQWDFVVPDHEPWPVPFRNEPLGRYVNEIRRQKATLQRHFPQRYRMLELMGFVFLPPLFEAPVETPDTRLPPWLRLETAELELTREDRRRKSRGRSGSVSAADFAPPEPAKHLDYDVYTVAQLKETCRHRGLKISGRNKAEYIARLVAYDHDFFASQQQQEDSAPGADDDLQQSDDDDDDDDDTIEEEGDFDDDAGVVAAEDVDEEGDVLALA